MSTPFKPEGYNSVSPYFIVKNALKFIDFLKEVFDADVTRRYDNADGSVMHCELRIDDSIIMLGEASERYPANQMLMHVYVSDVDAVFNKAIAAGAEVVDKPKEQEGDPDRRGTFTDPAGNIWSVGMQKA